MVARRDFLRKAAMAGTGAFVAPMIVTVNPADAQALTSPPPQPPMGERPPATIEPVAGPGARPRHAAAGRRVTDRTELPRTGVDVDQLVAAGLAATAGGAALVLWSAHARSTSQSLACEPAEPAPGT